MIGRDRIDQTNSSLIKRDGKWIVRWPEKKQYVPIAEAHKTFISAITHALLPVHDYSISYDRREALRRFQWNNFYCKENLLDITDHSFNHCFYVYRTDVFDPTFSSWNMHRAHWMIVRWGDRISKEEFLNSYFIKGYEKLSEILIKNPLRR